MEESHICIEVFYLFKLLGSNILFRSKGWMNCEVIGLVVAVVEANTLDFP